MAASASGPLGVLLMIAPLAAIPVLAIVGVPQFAPVSASPADEDEFDDLGEASASIPTPQPEPSHKPRTGSSLFSQGLSGPSAKDEAVGSRDSERPPITSQSPQPRDPLRELPPPEALDDWEVRPDLRGAADGSGRSKMPRQGANPGPELESPAAASDEDLVASDAFTADLLTPDQSRRDRKTQAGNSRGAPSRPKGNDAQPEAAPAGAPQGAEALGQLMAEQSGWQAAARRLKELGIRKYRLESQIEEQQFLFICSFASPRNPRVVRRFEATADNPLEAVQAVLEQIDEWRGRDGNVEEAPLTLDSE